MSTPPHTAGRPEGRGKAIFAVLFAAGMWGLWWWPVRLLEDAGVTGAWVGLAMTGAALPFSLIALAFRAPGWPSPLALAGGALLGAAVTLYSVSVAYTDFVRAVLLFYFSPAWSTLIECMFFGRRLDLRSVLSIVIALLGVGLISGGEISFDGLGAVGDWMALAAGAAWATGSAMVFAGRRVTVARMLPATMIAATAAAGVLLLILGSGGDAPVPRPADAAPPMLFAGVYIAALLAMTLWGAFRLPPATMMYLLSFEVLTGLASSVLILGETFGLVELGGAICVGAAILLEVLRPQTIAKPV